MLMKLQLVYLHLTILCICLTIAIVPFQSSNHHHASSTDYMSRYWSASSHHTSNFPDCLHYQSKPAEDELLHQLKQLIIFKYQPHNPEHDWLLYSATPIELLRFLRASGGRDISSAYSMLLQHAQWRMTSLGADATDDQRIDVDDYEITESLGRYVYWSGVTDDECAVLVVESPAFDIAAKQCFIFMRYLVDILENGKHQYGIGSIRKVRLIIDRSSGEESAYVQNIAYSKMYSILRLVSKLFQDNYPEMLHRAYILPVGPFFRGIYTLFSYLIKPSSRRKIVLIGSHDDLWWVSECFQRETVPWRLGGAFYVIPPNSF